MYIHYKSSSNNRVKYRRHRGRALIDHNGWTNDKPWCPIIKIQLFLVYRSSWLASLHCTACMAQFLKQTETVIQVCGQLVFMSILSDTSNIISSNNVGLIRPNDMQV